MAAQGTRIFAVTLLRRLISFYHRHGLRATVVRCSTAFHRLSHLGRMVLFSCPLPTAGFKRTAGIEIERFDEKTISQDDYACILHAWNPSLRAQQFPQRFAAGCHLWLAKIQGSLAGFGWTIQGRTMEPHFFPLQSDEVHLFDFFVFPEFRGRGINAALVMEILVQLSADTVRRAHIECAAWNQAQLRSLGKTPFRRCGAAIKLSFFGRTIVIWH